MRKILAIILLAVMILTAFTACGGESGGSSEPVAQIGDTATSTPSISQVGDENTMPSQEGAIPVVQEPEKAPLIIYHISDDEIELHFTSKELDIIEDIIFLANSGDSVYNPAVQLRLERSNGEINPYLMVLTDTMDMEYIIDNYGEEMETSVNGNTLICNIKHKNIIYAFDAVEIWHINTDKPTSFEGIITDDVSEIVEPVVDAVLPAEFKRTEYDDQYFKPDTDDFIVVTYDIPVRLWKLDWYMRYGVDCAYGARGAYGESYESTVKVTYLMSFDKEKYLGMKVRLEYATIDDAMVAGYVADIDLVPSELGMPNEETDDPKVFANFFQACDKRFFGQREETDYEVIYQGHFDQFRYFDFKAQDTLQEVERLASIRLSENSDAIAFIPISSINYTAGKAENTTLINYGSNCEAASFSSKRTNKAGSDDDVLDIILKLSGDAKNFTPITDDYAYVVEEDIRGDEAYDHYRAEGIYEQFLHLYSFDENGNAVQWMYRRYHIDHLSDDFEGSEFEESFKKWTFDKESGAYYIDYLVENEGSQTKDELLTDLLRYGEHEGFYFSKP